MEAGDQKNCGNWKQMGKKGRAHSILSLGLTVTVNSSIWIYGCLF